MMNKVSSKKNVLLLAIALALSMTGTAVIVTVAALAGELLAPDKRLATLPLALTFTATMLTTIPASLWMKRIGRRRGFLFGQILGLTAACLASGGLALGSFWLFTAGSALLGSHNAFYQYYRFAAAEVADEDFRPRAISWVLAGGVAAALFGPELAKATRLLVPGIEFAGSYLTAAALCIIALPLILRVDTPTPTTQENISGRPLGEIVREPKFRMAVLAGMVGWGAMVLLMTATPLAMKGHHHLFGDIAFVIQWHILGMYAPSFVTGSLIKRFGVMNVISLGAVLNLAAAAVNLTGMGLANYWLGLLLLGIGWNFMFVGATALLTESYRPEEAAKVQALNDFMIFSLVTVASFSSGALQATIGWQAVNWGIIPPVAATLLTFYIGARRRKSLSSLVDTPPLGEY